MKKYYHGLDGLRAFAIISVILYHLLPNVFRGGFLGVPLFFAISGFLIVSPLVTEKFETGKLDFKKFYLKRLKRIYPSLIIMVLVVGIVGFGFYGDKDYLKESLSGLLGVNNYWQLSNQVSYFDQFKDVRLLKHLWSLSVELQFYLLIPFFINWLIVGKRYSIMKLKEVFVLLSLASWLLMMVVFLFKGPSVVYYLFTTRFFSFSLGMLASYFCFYEKKKLPEKVGIAAVALMLLMTFTVRDYQVSTYMFWIFLYSCLGSLSIWAIVTNKRLNSYLSVIPLRVIGVRSYDIFLWYYPVITIYQKFFKWDGSLPVFHILLQCTIIFLLSHVSFHLSRVITGKRTKAEYFRLLIACEGVLLMGVSIAVYQVVDAKIINPPLTAAVESTVPSETKNNVNDATTKETKEITEETVEEVKKEIPAITEDVLFIGDSVILGTEHYVYQEFTGPNTYVRAKVGKQPYEIWDDFNAVNLSLYKKVVIALGNNGLMEKSDFDQIMTYLKDKEVIFVNTAVSRPWKKSNNDLIDSYVKKYDNVHLADWDKKIGNVDERTLLVEDGVHLSEEGCQEYTYLLKEAVFNLQ